MTSEYDASASGPAQRRAIDAFLKELSGWLGDRGIDEMQQGSLVTGLSRFLPLPPQELYRLLQRMGRRAPGASGVGSAVATTHLNGVGRSTSQEQEALRQILEVLLNEPQRYSVVAEHFDPAGIADPALAAIGRAIVETLREYGSEGFRLDEFLGRFESLEDGRLITDLQARGERRGGYAAVIDGAIQCLQQVRKARQAVALAEEIRSGKVLDRTPAGPEASENDDARLAALIESARQPNFAPLRARQRELTG